MFKVTLPELNKVVVVADRQEAQRVTNAYNDLFKLISPSWRAPMLELDK